MNTVTLYKAAILVAIALTVIVAISGNMVLFGLLAVMTVALSFGMAKVESSTK